MSHFSILQISAVQISDTEHGDIMSHKQVICNFCIGKYDGMLDPLSCVTLGYSTA